MAAEPLPPSHCCHDFWGSIADLPLVWNLADLFMAFMVLTNVSAIILLFPQARACLLDYESS